MRRISALALAIGVLLGGCAPDGSRDPAVIRYANWGGASEDNAYERTVAQLYKEFQDQNPGVELRQEKIPGSGEYVNKMLLSFVAGTEPDVMALDASSAAVFINNGVLRDLRPLFKVDTSFQLSDYWPNAVQVAKRGEQLYAVPGDFTPMVIYYNKKLFDAAGVPYPPENWTFKQFLETARKLTIPGKQFGFKFDNWMPGWIVWLWNNGADTLSPDGAKSAGYLDSRKAVETLTFLRDLVVKYRVAPSLSSSSATGVDPFANGTAAMQISGHWALVGLSTAPKVKLEDIGITRVPSQLSKPVTVMYEVGYAIGKNCKYPEAAWKLVRFLTSKRFQTTYNGTGIAICGRKDVAFGRGKDPREAAFLQIVPSARAPWGSRVEGYEYVEAEGAKMMDKILSGVDPQVAATATAKRIDAYFKVR